MENQVVLLADTERVADGRLPAARAGGGEEEDLRPLALQHAPHAIEAGTSLHRSAR